MNPVKFIPMLVLSAVFAGLSPAAAQTENYPPGTQTLSIEDFLTRATHNDTFFQEILIDELALQYRKDLQLPAKDLVLAITADHKFMLNKAQEALEGSIGLSKLFPKLGTALELEYETTPVFTDLSSDFSREENRTSSYTAQISQPILENAFGKATRLLDKIIGIEIDVASYQIVEAYEDYLAEILFAYLDWYEAYENLKVAQSSYDQNKKLLDNMKDRQKNSIALPIDVNKVDLQVLAREERLITADVRHQNTYNTVLTALRANATLNLEPQAPKLYDELDLNFDGDYAGFRGASRTFEILELLENRSALDVARNANQLLPSIDLRVGFTSEWDGSELRKEDNLWFAGMTIAWPFNEQVERAEYEISKISQKKSSLTTQNTHFRLYTGIKNLYQQIEREKTLIEIAEKRIRLAESVLKDEAENYTYGRAILNDYIDAVNAFDDNRFNRILHLVQMKRLIVELLRISDRLVTKDQLRDRYPSL